MDETAWSKYPQRRDCRGPTVRRDQESQAACRQLLSTEGGTVSPEGLPGGGCSGGQMEGVRLRGGDSQRRKCSVATELALRPHLATLIREL